MTPLKTLETVIAVDIGAFIGLMLLLVFVAICFAVVGAVRIRLGRMSGKSLP